MNTGVKMMNANQRAGEANASQDGADRRRESDDHEQTEDGRPERPERQKIDEQPADECPCHSFLEADDQREEDGNHEDDLRLCVGKVDPRGDRHFHEGRYCSADRGEYGTH